MSRTIDIISCKTLDVIRSKIRKCKTSTCLEKEIIFDVEHQHDYNTDIFRFKITECLDQYIFVDISPGI